MLIINICLGLVLICSVSLSLWFNFKYRKTLKHFKSFDVLSKEIDKYEARMNTLAAEAMEVEFSLKQKIERQKELETAILIADSKREAAE